MSELDILREFVADVDAVHDWAKKEWPDLMVTYRKAKGLLDESVPFKSDNHPEQPTESEVKILAYAYADTCLVAEDSEDRDSAIEDEVQGPGGGLEQVQSAYIAVFRNYITGGPGYMGAVYLILWDGAPEFVSVAYWERSPRRIKMIHYGNV